MIQLLAKCFVKDYKNMSQQKVRQSYGVLCAVTGICLNLCLFLGKVLVGSMSRSISITADAFNNLSDAASSLITLVGFRLAAMKADARHPFGHGRMEYISALIVSGLILMMAFELLKTSVEKIFHPTPVEYYTVTAVILVLSIFVKLYMFFYNFTIGKKIQAASMKATAIDSLSDAAATAMVFVTTLIEYYTDFKIDGYAGIIVGILIFLAGIGTAKETLNPLLGQSPDPEFVQRVQELVLSYPQVQGVHDLLVHDYGPGRMMISLHAEVPADGDLLLLHDTVDNIELQLKKELQCEAVIHMDPIITNDERVLWLKQKIHEIVKDVSAHLSIHDFRVVSGPTHTNLIFDLVIPFRFSETEKEVVEKIQQKVFQVIGENFFCVMQIDKQ